MTPTATGATPTATETATANPGPTATPELSEVTFTVDDPNGDLVSVPQFTLTANYLPATGSFLVNGAASCTVEDDDLNTPTFDATDDGNGTLTVAVTGTSVLPVDVTCEFIDISGSGSDDITTSVTNGLVADVF